MRLALTPAPSPGESEELFPLLEQSSRWVDGKAVRIIEAQRWLFLLPAGEG